MTPQLLNNRYRILQNLGAGGFGNTFLAEDSYMPSGRRCVIKHLKPVTHDPQMYKQIQQRFAREAATLEQLGEGSDQIPKLYAYFSEGGQFYLVQEFIDGSTLTKKVQQQGKLSENTVKEILVSLLPVLDYVHSKQMVHRDIKPDNIIVRQRDGKPVLIDFGAVKESMGAASPMSGNPAPSIVIGTPGFMPPEQAAGQPVYSSDLYSLGLTAIYMLSGKLPQELQTDPLSAQILWRQHGVNVSPSLAAVLDKAIQSHPRDRYLSAREMLNALHSGAVSPSSPDPSGLPTVAVSPGAQHHPGSSPQPVPVVVPPTVPQGNPQYVLLIGSLIAGSLVAVAVVFNLLSKRSPEPSSQVASSPPPASQQPAPERNTVPTSSPAKRSRVKPPPVIAESPTPAPPQSRETEPARSPEPIQSRSPQPEPAQSRSPEPVRSPQPAPTRSPAPLFRRSPSPEPARSPQPAPTPENNNQNPNLAANRVPAFPVGTPRSTVEATLGTRTRDSRGTWGATRAVIYNFVPNQIDLGYLYDSNSGRIRQTEASFAESVDPQVMLTTLDGMLEGGSTDYIKRGLEKVQKGRSISYTFTQGSLRGQIVRQDCGFIYISIWEANLHDFDVSSARKC